MTTLYWVCLLGGFGVTVLLFFVGEVLDGVLDALDLPEGFDGVLDPLALVVGVTFFGGAGLILERTAWSSSVQLIVAIAVAIGAAVLLSVLYITPMKKSENSTGFSEAEYAGKTGEVNTSIPSSGYGEVTVRMGASTTFQTAASFAGQAIRRGTRVVVVEVDADGVLRVAPLDDEEVAVPASAPAPSYAS